MLSYILKVTLCWSLFYLLYHLWLGKETFFKNNRWYKIRLRVTKKRIDAWVDDKQIVNLERLEQKFSIWFEQEPAKPLGITNWNTGSAIRKIVIHPLTPAELKENTGAFDD